MPNVPCVMEENPIDEEPLFVEIPIEDVTVVYASGCSGCNGCGTAD